PGEERAHAERAGHLVGDQDAADGRRQHRAHTCVLEGRGEVGTERGRVLGVLQHQRRLQIDLRMQAGGEAKVAAHESAGLLVEGERFLFGHPESSSSTAWAAALGFGAAVMGRPTTMLSAPAWWAAEGVAERT